jgi:protein-tyrosine phosphatase
LSDAPFRILLVCTGNICRSPLAERLMRVRLTAELGSAAADSFHVSSAGTRAWEGLSMDRTAARELLRLGGNPAGFRSRQLVAPQVEGADLVLTATVAHRSAVLSETPEALRRTFTIRELAVLATTLTPDSDLTRVVAQAAASRSVVPIDYPDVIDPYDAPAHVHRDVANQLSSAIGELVGLVLRARWPKKRWTESANLRRRR